MGNRRKKKPKKTQIPEKAKGRTNEKKKTPLIASHAYI